MTHTPGTLEERARAIYAQFIIDNTPGAGPDDVPRFDDNAHGVRIALAALTEAADEIASLRARVEALETALVSEREDNLWHAYHSGFVRNGEWDHMCMSDGEWLAMECGFNVKDRRIADADIRAAIPEVARQALKDTPG